MPHILGVLTPTVDGQPVRLQFMMDQELVDTVARQVKTKRVDQALVHCRPMIMLGLNISISDAVGKRPVVGRISGLTSDRLAIVANLLADPADIELLIETAGRGEEGVLSCSTSIVSKVPAPLCEPLFEWATDQALEGHQ